MPNIQCSRARERQRIHARVAETRRVPLSEVPYPRANIEFYRYLFEAGEISQHQYEHLVYRLHYPLLVEIRDYHRNNRNNVNYQMEHPMEGNNIIGASENRTRNIPDIYERIINHHGERLSESNNSLCRECLMPIVLGNELCEECQQEK